MPRKTYLLFTEFDIIGRVEDKNNVKQLNILNFEGLELVL